MPEEIKPGEGENGGSSGGYTPPATQDELNKIVEARLARERAKFADYDDLKTKASEYDKVTEASKTELQKERERAEAAERKAAAYEAKEQVAAWASEIVKGSSIPANALRGSTKEELTEHFEVLKGIAPAPAQRRGTPPGKQRADGEKPGSRAAQALRDLRNG